jgi:hypothetical protein
MSTPMYVFMPCTRMLLLVCRAIAYTSKSTVRPTDASSKVEVKIHFFFNYGTRWGWVVNTMPRPLYPRERRHIRCIGGWSAYRDSMDGRGKFCSLPPPGRGQSILYWVVLPTTLLWPIKTRIYTCWCVCVCTSTDSTLRQQNKEEIVTGLSIAAIQQLWQEPVKCIAKEGITKDNIDHKQINRIIKQNPTTSKPHLTKQCKTRQLHRLYSRKQPRCRRRSIRCKPRQRNVWRSTKIINNKTILFYKLVQVL